ncbi:DHA2 family multidrug resistance protein-like MFS transporter [Geomicrobium halophilum]|uniref:DHA2 family multidrug resistance protein-like MFS transporter n=1 Tax=Geomicrobium halophilum TaxID=549000 RepID=A0A841Q0W9_9BACL|nr:MFS transporter [Geomicrobium halophilum]MBB6451402.1 DHA2 family multidrug resistance protein-like MFS transporter [Geomicrobium halophilum]
MSSKDEVPRATWQEWMGLGALTLAVFMLATDISILFLAMPSIAADLAPSSTQMLWIIHIGELLAVGFALTMGRLGDKIGRRRLLVIGISVYGLASFIAAFSTEAWMLIATRALLGVATATVMPSTMSLLRNMFFDRKQFSVAIAINLSAFSAGMALGPPMGGLLLDYFWWGAVFLVNVPVAIGLLAASRLLPEYRNKDSKPMDFISVLLSSLALVTLIFGLQEMANDGFNMLYGGSVVIGIAVGVLFIKRQMNTEDPLLDLHMFRIPVFSFSLIAVTVVLLVTTGADMLFAQHLQAVVGLTPTEAGLLLIIPALLSMAGTLISPVLTRWMRPAYAMVSGLLTAAGGALLIMLTVHDAGAIILIIGVSLLGFGGGPTMTIASEQIISSVPQERAGTASAMSDVSTGLGSVLSIAFIGSLGMLVYRGVLASSLPSEVPSEIANSSMESVGAAVAAAEGFPQMLQAVQSSFTVALQAVFGIAAIGLFVLMIFIVWKLRHVRQEDKASNEQETSF